MQGSFWKLDFFQQSVEIVLSAVLMWASTDAKFNNSVIYERKICMSRTRTLLTLVKYLRAFSIYFLLF